MSTDPQPLVDVRRLATRAGVLLLIATDVVIVFASSRAPLRNPDTYFHLRFGEEFLHHWSIAHPGQPNAASSASWVPTQWLSQVVWALVEDRAGAAGLATLSAALVVAMLAAIYLAARVQAGPIASLAATTLALLASMHWLGLRPQVISFGLTALTVLAWNRSRVHRTTPWWLIPVTWVWAMCHGMWILGVVIGLAAVLGLALEQRDARLAVRRLAVPIGCLAAAAVTPVGPRLLGAVLLVNSRASHYAEWNPVPLLHGWGLPTAVLIGTVAVVRMRRGPTPAYPAVMLGLAVLFAAYSGRTIVTAIIIASTLLAAEVTRRGPRPPVRRREHVCVAGAALVALAAGAVAGTMTVPGLDADVRPFYPQVAALPAGTVVLTDHAEGAVLLWRFPALEVPLHGYGDVFTTAELDRYDALGDVAPGWERTVARLHAEAAVLPPDTALAYALRHQLGWTVVAHDRTLVLLQAGPDDHRRSR